jgi:hypothetical protein
MFKFKKTKLADMERAYAVSSLTIDNKKLAVFAGEAIDAPCYAFDLSNNTQQTIWAKAGGTMSFVAIPNTNGEFIAVQNFFPAFASKNAKLVWGKYKNGEWDIKDLGFLPYLHRFDLIEIEGEIYIFACQLCKEKHGREDWSSDGGVYLAKLPAQPQDGLDWVLLKDGFHQNHGFVRANYLDKECLFVSSKEGIFIFQKPETATDEWQITQIADFACGEVALIDIDDDGELEFATIEPFHGDKVAVYKMIDSKLVEVFRYPFKINFAHALIAGSLVGKNVFMLGVRRESAELALIYYENGGFQVQKIDESFGPSNLYLLDNTILAANHTKNEAAVYVFE